MAMLLVASLALTGCSSILTGRANMIQLKVIDSKTGLPVPGVSALWREDFDDVFFGHFQTGPLHLPPSDDAGIITINDVRNKMTGRLVFSCPGYVPVYGFCSDGSLTTSEEIQPPPMPQDLFILDDGQTAMETGNGSYLIKMSK
jgi:hypothetical protein